MELIDQTVEETPTQTQEVTVTPESEEIQPEIQDPIDQESKPEPEKKFTQQELDSILEKRLARQKRELQRRQPSSPNSTIDVNTQLNPEHYSTNEDYIDALATQKAEKIAQEREIQQESQKVYDAYADKTELAREKYPDFESVVGSSDFKVTDVMIDAIITSENGPDIAYHLAKNSSEAEKISKLSPLLQIKEIGKLEVKLASSPPVKKVTNAPDPISPINSGNTKGAVYDTTDPRSVDSMSTSDWINAERKRMVEKAKSKYK